MAITNIVAYSGPARPVNDAYEGKAAFRPVRWNDDDGSLYAGYQRIADAAVAPKFGTLGGSCMQVSATRQAALDAANAAEAANENQVATFRASIVALAQKVKDNTATAAEQRQLIVKLSRVSAGVLSDLP